MRHPSASPVVVMDFLAASNFDYALVARRFGVTVRAIERVERQQSEQAMAATEARQVKRRTCLICDRLFRSTDPGHRVCDSCRETGRERGGVTVAVTEMLELSPESCEMSAMADLVGVGDEMAGTSVEARF